MESSCLKWLECLPHSSYSQVQKWKRKNKEKTAREGEGGGLAEVPALL